MALHSDTMFGSLFSRRRVERMRTTPPDTRIYVIGDIHGRLDLLRRLHDAVRGDAADAAPRRVLVYPGDYVDRGEQSRQVLDLLIDHPLEGFERVLLRGNHEDMMSTFLEDLSIAGGWMMNGGDATLFSYGVGAPEQGSGEERLLVMQAAFREKVPPRHREFLRDLRLHHIEGDYLFVHAGVRPGQPVEDQTPRDLIWIREPFLSSTAEHGYCVVHGHTVVEKPEFHANRIAIDTGAYFSNRLTCLVLEGTGHRIIQT